METTAPVPAAILAPHLARPVLLALTLTVASGLADAYGFVHAARIWRSDLPDLGELGRSAAGFGTGMAAQWLAIRYLHRLGITLAEVQAIAWFVVAMVGIALLNRTFFDWAPTDRMVGLGVVLGLGWLIARTGG